MPAGREGGGRNTQKKIRQLGLMFLKIDLLTIASQQFVNPPEEAAGETIPPQPLLIASYSPLAPQLSFPSFAEL